MADLGNIFSFFFNSRINPKRTLPVAIAISVAIITAVYLLANISYFAILPLETVQVSKVIAIELGYKMLGTTGVYLICGFVALSALGAVNGTIIGNSRLFVTAAEDGILFPKFMAAMSPRNTPVRGIIASCVIMSLLLLPDGGFALLAPLYSYTTWAFYCVTVIALLHLRKKEPMMSRPFKVPSIVAYVFVALCIPIILLQFYDEDVSIIHFFCVDVCVCCSVSCIIVQRGGK
jgi:amino acid transporter